MKSLNIDIIFPWEVGLLFIIIGLFFIIFGVRQSKLVVEDFDNSSKNSLVLVKATPLSIVNVSF